MRVPAILAVPVLVSSVACSSESVTSPESLVLETSEARALTFTSSTRAPLNTAVFVPCAGEVVQLSGTVHVLIHTTFRAEGGNTIVVHSNPQSVSGLGQSSGASYRGVGVTRSVTTAIPGSTFTSHNNFSVIGQGPGNNFRMRAHTHVTIHADGRVTASVTSSDAYCG